MNEQKNLQNDANSFILSIYVEGSEKEKELRRRKPDEINSFIFS